MFRNCSSQWFKHFDLVVIKLKNTNFGFGIIERNTRVWDWHRHLTGAWNSDKHVGEDGLSCCADGEPTSASILCNHSIFEHDWFPTSPISNLEHMIWVLLYAIWLNCICWHILDRILNLLILNSTFKMQAILNILRQNICHSLWLYMVEWFIYTIVPRMINSYKNIKFVIIY